GFGVAYGAYRPPLGLEPLHLRRGGLPVAGRHELLGPRAQCFLALEVRRPLVLAPVEVLLAPAEEAVRGPAKALPEGLGRLVRRGTDLLPLALQTPELVGGLQPVRRPGEGLRPADQLFLSLEIGLAFFLLLGEVGLEPRMELVARRLEAQPQRLGLIARGLPHLAPREVDLAEPPQRLLEVLLRQQRLRALAQLFLLGGVGPAGPFVGLTQLLGLREQRGPGRLQPVRERLALLPVRDRGERIEGGALVAQRALDLTQRRLLGAREDLQPPGEGLGPGQGLLAAAQLGLPRLRLRVLFLRCPLGGFLPGVPPGRDGVVAPPALLHRTLESSVQLVQLGGIDLGSHALPDRPGLLQVVEGLLAREA